MRIFVFTKTNRIEHDKRCFEKYEADIINFNNLYNNDCNFCNFLKCLYQNDLCLHSPEDILKHMNDNFKITLDDLIILHVGNNYEIFKQILSFLFEGIAPFNFIMFSSQDGEIDTHGMSASEISNINNKEQLIECFKNKILNWDLDYDAYLETPNLQKYISSILSI